MANITIHSCSDFSWVATYPISPMPFENHPSTHGYQKGLQNNPQLKQTSKLLAVIHT